MTKLLRIPFLKARTKAAICRVLFACALFATLCIIGGLEKFSISPSQAVTYISLGFIIMTLSGLKGGVFRK